MKDPFWNQPEWLKDWDLADIKPQDEMDLGAQFHSLIMQLGLVDEQSPVQGRVDDAAVPFLARLDRPKISYQCFILKSDAVNAFSAPGGYIYVCQGLFDLIAEDEDDALEFAIGHEIAHVDLKHAITCLVDPDVKRMPLGTVQKLFWLIILRGYLVIDKVDHKVDQELDADQWVLKRMRRFPRSRREIL